jgi:hypothetical protein
MAVSVGGHDELDVQRLAIASRWPDGGMRVGNVSQFGSSNKHRAVVDYWAVVLGGRGRVVDTIYA